MKPSLCLNMIVRNESARIERCLASATPYVKAMVIHDTGSDDDTCARITTWCANHNIPCYVSHGPFENFSQARNVAFRSAQDRTGRDDVPFCQFALLMDADMELVVSDPKAFDNLDASAAGYDMMQKGGTVSYANRRILNLDCKKPPYVGVTHEYIDVPAAGMITGASFVDHADGSNRADKFPRDAALLEAALRDDPDNGRTWYYLGNTYRDWGRPDKAAGAYAKRIALGGWDEETHSAKMNLAYCLRDQGDHAGFVAAMIEAYSFRPTRTEPLYDLAKYFREKGDNAAAALLFAKAGLDKPRPNDLLFVNDFVYSHGLRYEYSISGYYDPKERARAAGMTDDLSLDPTCPTDYRLSARNNLYWHTKPLSHYCPSFKGTRLDFAAPVGYVATNPSIEECNGKIKCNIRCVNYRIDEHGRYLINGSNGEANGTNPIDTRNFIARLDVNLQVKDAFEVIWQRPVPCFDLVTGLEDIRLYRHHGELWFNACVREQNPGGVCQQFRGKLEMGLVDQKTLENGVRVTEWHSMSGVAQHEKNWMAMGNHRFLYRLDTIVDDSGNEIPAQTTEKTEIKVCPDNISGSSQCIRFKGGLLAVVHEAITGPDGKRTYWHRFAWFERDGRLRRLSLPFVFYDRQIEFCAGLAYHPNNRDLLISFGVRDEEAHVATVSIEEVALMCWKFHEN